MDMVIKGMNRILDALKRAYFLIETHNIKDPYFETLRIACGDMLPSQICHLAEYIKTGTISADNRYGKDVKPEPVCKCKTCRKLRTPKPLAQYLGEYLAAEINRAHEKGYPVDYTREGLKYMLEQALDAYESTENVKIKIEKC